MNQGREKPATRRKVDAGTTAEPPRHRAQSFRREGRHDRSAGPRCGRLCRCPCHPRPGWRVCWKSSSRSGRSRWRHRDVGRNPKLSRGADDPRAGWHFDAVGMAGQRGRDGGGNEGTHGRSHKSDPSSTTAASAFRCQNEPSVTPPISFCRTRAGPHQSRPASEWRDPCPARSFSSATVMTRQTTGW